MSTADRPEDLRRHPAVRTYLYLALAALGAVLLILLAQGHGPWSLLPVLVGLLGLARCARSAPLLFLGALYGFVALRTVLLPEWMRFEQAPAFHVSDWALAGAVLAYVMAHYRLQSMLVFAFPPDPRRREGPPRRPILFWKRRALVVRQRRPPHLVSTWEFTWFGLSLLLWATLAQVCWRLVPRGPQLLAFPPRGWRTLFLVWFVGTGLMITAALLGYVRQRLMTGAEARLFLQDTLWRETSREQRRIQRWRVWARLRRRRKELS